ncbi:AbrB/MazE/SpoVT family DNA-binding domain-containing protein [candidate division KSB1 bacterium]|nr:MAG: AbrB/MazE/SpoVT family DNA-binding domain-containing protein [candidate division KSB1 bacterium]MBC6946432.1 AbrB/MazE/SpoVT family DNA-binding domain-containing protein [candidate division KSB1 bacterium]MCE7942381.1 AbrB/MazE/SpoVT family DNA-binding domain-containing protein [Chlorobi bacterium CHB1]MDL1877296.1 AbrB/MazE/SpoVT family DNA-binding domain-containing protein [Cytophagia bacterium CHB2]
MKTRIVQVGNSQGIRIPKVLLEQSGLTDEVELEVKDRQIIIRTAHKPRCDWENRFQAMANNGDDELLDKNELPYQSSWDDKEWSW